MQDAWRAYLELAFGLTEASKKKAKKVAKDMVGKGGATAAQLQSFAEDLVSTSRTNREGLARLVRYEVDRALGALGFATAEEVAALTNRIKDLERQAQETQAPETQAPETQAPETQAPETQAPAPAPAAAAAKAPAGAPASTPRKTTAKKTVAKKTVARKAPAKKTAAPGKTAAAGTAAKKTAG